MCPMVKKWLNHQTPVADSVHVTTAAMPYKQTRTKPRKPMHQLLHSRSSHRSRPALRFGGCPLCKCLAYRPTTAEHQDQALNHHLSMAMLNVPCLSKASSEIQWSLRMLRTALSCSLVSTNGKISPNSTSLPTLSSIL